MPTPEAGSTPRPDTMQTPPPAPPAPPSPGGTGKENKQLRQLVAEMEKLLAAYRMRRAPAGATLDKIRKLKAALGLR